MQTYHSSAHALNKLLTQKNLKTIVAKAQLLVHINQLIRETAGEEVAMHVCAADITADYLAIQADSAAWGMRLRFLESTLLLQLRLQPAYAKLQEIRIKVRPTLVDKPRHYWSKPVLSASSAENIATTADYIEDEKLRKALRRLAARCTQNIV